MAPTHGVNGIQSRGGFPQGNRCWFAGLFDETREMLMGLIRQLAGGLSK